MKIGIIGLGLIGGSVSLAAHKAGHEVYGFDPDNDAKDKALASGAIKDIAEISVMRDMCELIVVCVPARTAVAIVEEALKGSAIVTDVSSTKSSICEKVNELEPELANKFIGGHPMAGSEQSGFDAARDNLFENKMWILVPPTSSSLTHISTVENFVSSLGAEHCILEPRQHDELVAYISHLPQLASSVLMDLASKESVDNEILLRLAGGGFRDMTRIASNNIKMWLDIVQENKTKISNALEDYISQLQKLKQEVDDSNLEEITQLFERARGARRSLPEAARRLENLSEILVPVPDTPGVLTSITSLAENINIYDIKIVHALEQDRGVLSLVVDPHNVDALVDRLTNAGFEARSIELNGL